MQTNSIEIINIYNETLYTYIDDNKELKLGLEQHKDIMIFCTINQKTESNEILLTNLLKACNIANDTCRILFLNDVTQVFKYIQIGKPQIILSFGVAIKTELFQLLAPLYQPTKMANQEVLLSEPLTILQNDKAKKQLLWAALQQLFKING
jgi:DNA polymerase III psi subunit